MIKNQKVRILKFTKIDQIQLRFSFCIFFRKIALKVKTERGKNKLCMESCNFSFQLQHFEYFIIFFMSPCSHCTFAYTNTSHLEKIKFFWDPMALSFSCLIIISRAYRRGWWKLTSQTCTFFALSYALILMEEDIKDA